MPYEYRKLSTKEREPLIIARSARGYPRHAPPHLFRGTDAYLISAANFEHKAVMNSLERRTEFEIFLLQSLKEITDEIIAWVILPNHYHFLVAVQSLDRVSIALKQLHGSTSRQWIVEDGMTGKRRVWYKFADTCIGNDAYLRLAFNYIHYNPVKHGYVKDPYDWQWPSLGIYCQDKGKDWLREQWKSYSPPSDFGRGWDDDLRGD